MSTVSENMLTYLSQHDDCLNAMAYTLACRREALPFRSFAIASSKDIGAAAATVAPPIKAAAASPDLVMIFTGQGAQCSMMGAALLQSSEFRRDLEELDAILQSCAKPPAWSIIEELSKTSENSRVYDAELSQPLCAAVQLGLVEDMKRKHVRPSTVIEHSSGEIAAAYAAEALSKREAILIAYYRGLVSLGRTRTGGMAAIGLSAS